MGPRAIGARGHRGGYGSVVADTEYARQSVAALVAKSYFLAVEATLQLRLAEDTVATSQQLVTFAEQRQRIGKGDGYDTALARANLGDLPRHGREAQAVAGAGAARARGAGRPVSGGGRARSRRNSRSRRGPFPPACRPNCWNGDRTSSPPTGASRLRSMASRKPRRRGCPRISLTASVNDISSDLFVLKNRDNPVWSAGASLLQPVFNAGALQTQVRIRTAEQKQAIAEYGPIGARAFAEVEDALSAEFAAGRREAVLRRAVAENQTALEFAQQRFKVGSGDMRAVSQQQLALFGATSALLRVQSERLVQRVNLYLALGGGFDAAPATPAGCTDEGVGCSARLIK